MEIKRNKQPFTKEMLYKHTEIIMKYNKELFENLSSLVDRKQQINDFSYVNTYKKLPLYENKITSLNVELDQLKKENVLLQIQNKVISSIKEDTQQLKTLISTI